MINDAGQGEAALCDFFEATGKGGLRRAIFVRGMNMLMPEIFDTFILGQPALDVNTDYDGTVVRAMGGAVVYSGYAAAALGHSVAVLAKAGPDVDLKATFAGARGIAVYPLQSDESTSIENTYFTPDRERRESKIVSRIAPYRVEEIPDVQAHIYHLAGLMAGDLNEEILAFAAGKAAVAVDVQSFLRHDENGSMVFYDWPRKTEMLPLITYLKTDAAEAEILTGLASRADAAKQLHAWGAKEVMITHNSEVLVYDGETLYTQPLKPRNLSGRTGRGDTCFAGYITERLARPPEEALCTAAALVSLKMETPGPFLGGREDVEAYQKEFYAK